MGKPKSEYIFNKNHVSISRTTNLPEGGKFIATKAPSYGSRPYKIYDMTHDRHSKTGRKIKCESPLGFYYYKDEHKGGVTRSDYNRIQSQTQSKTQKSIVIRNGSEMYEITYLTHYGQQIISKDLRPWDIVEGDKSMEDHYVTDLLNDVENIFQYIKDNKISGRLYRNINSYGTRYKNEMPHYDTDFSYYESAHIVEGEHAGETEVRPIDMGALKREIFTDLFGDPKGPRFQTNEEKILAHGFDLKTSFRKM